MTNPLRPLIPGLLDEAAIDTLLFLSPHLDDAVLSCGALLLAAAPVVESIVATSFTAASPPPLSRPARRFIQSCAASDAEQLYDLRRAEDASVIFAMGAIPVHLGFTDALFRRRNVDPTGPKEPVEQPNSRVARVTQRSLYPTYRFDLARGYVAAADAAIPARLAAEIARTTDLARTVVLAPLAVGGHVDHRLTRDAAVLLSARTPAPAMTVYYSDFPYSLNATPDRAFVSERQLVPRIFADGRRRAARFMAGYQTQHKLLFPSGGVPERPEVYWAPAAASR